jgi:dTDP-4-amino-4,6-dideoxygalactose transaminase
MPYLEEIWSSHILTNNGPFHQKLEQKLSDYLGVKYVSLFSSGTMALMAALHILKISGEVVTTPFTFVATAHSLLLNNIKPVFVDIDPVTYNLDPDKIEEALTPETKAILPVHVFGNPCDVIKIQQIANKHGLKVIYDAAHSFGVKLKGTSVTNFGDLSVLSFHAIKVFNTFEGGAVICHDGETKNKLDQFKNFGIKGDSTVASIGTNSKMNEFQAALGLLQLEYIDESIAKRKNVASLYTSELKRVTGIVLLHDIPGVKHNYSYFPILIDFSKFGKTRNEVFSELERFNIYGRRYFYPLLSQLSFYNGLPSSKPGKMPVAERVTEQVLCIPIYPDLDADDAIQICRIISKLRS